MYMAFFYTGVKECNSNYTVPRSSCSLTENQAELRILIICCITDALCERSKIFLPWKSSHAKNTLRILHTSQKFKVRSTTATIKNLSLASAQKDKAWLAHKAETVNGKWKRSFF